MAAPKKFAAKKVAMFTDIHFGKRSNSIQHNQDCLDFVKWFCRQVRHEGGVTHVAFLGDWFENRNAVNVLTLTYAHEALKELNALGLPIFIIIGNHDLYHRENRKIFSTRVFEDLPNVQLINEPEIFEDLLLCPFMFKGEYPELAKFGKVKYWLGHFEFRNFLVTGSDRIMEHGPEHTLFKDPKYIFSGHFHKRQVRDNVIYIGNTFPMDYGDAGDDERGCCFLNTADDNVWFVNWDEAPSFRKIKLSKVLEGNSDFPPKCRVRCTIDTEILYSEAQALREEMVSNLGLREFSLEENLFERQEAIAGDDSIESFELSSLNDAVVKLLQTGVTGTSTIDPERLINIYHRL
jgi:DNA repair exonuclease SbcCD nuclease subunit